MLNIIPVTPAGPAQKVTELTSSNQTTLIASAVGTAVWQSPTTTLVNASLAQSYALLSQELQIYLEFRLGTSLVPPPQQTYPTKEHTASRM
jgi:hypothetical protein